MRALASLGVFALLASACTAIVAGELNKYDGYRVSDSLSPHGNDDPCALTDPDASNACSTCIAQSCAADIAYACPADGGTPKPWFSGLQKCAQNPYQGYDDGYLRYSCRPYEDPDAQPFTGNDDNAKERAAMLCVRNNCLDSGTPPCHQCVVGIQKTGTAGGFALLDDTKCGQCIRRECGDLLVKCCESNLPEGLTSCAYTDDPELKQQCHDAVYHDAGGPDARPNSVGTDLCTWEFAQTCLPKCQTSCP
jgi:hypothetical protein